MSVQLPDPVPVLQAQGLGFAHPGGPPVFSGLDFTLPAGLTRLDAETGKTTLLRLLAGELRGEGRFQLRGEACWIDPRDPRWDGSTPAEVAAQVRGRHAGFDDTAWQRHVAGFELVAHGHKTMHMLSTGTRRKVALAAALASGAALVLLDEPTAGLDAPALAWLQQALVDEARQARRAWLIAAAWGLETRLPWSGVLAW